MKTPTCSTDAAFRDLSGEVSEQAAEEICVSFQEVDEITAKKIWQGVLYHWPRSS